MTPLFSVLVATINYEKNLALMILIFTEYRIVLLLLNLIFPALGHLYSLMRKISIFTENFSLKGLSQEVIS